MTGHKFSDRSGHFNRNSSEEAPIFVQFLDCVYNIMKQFPCSFQFNEEFLVAIVDHLYSCRFGTFLFNSEKEREDHHLKNRTVSLWSCLNSNMQLYINPFYTHNAAVLYPISDIKRLSLWTRCYLRWHRNMKDQEAPSEKIKLLEDKCAQLSKRVEELQKMCI